MDETRAFVAGCELFLRKHQPDVVWTYGSDLACRALHTLAKALDIPVLFALHNLAYHDPEAFSAVDQVFVPSEFARRHYWEKLGLACQLLPCVLDGKRVEVAERSRSA